MAFVEDDEAYTIEQVRVVTEGEIELLWRGDDDVAFTQEILVHFADADRAIET